MYKEISKDEFQEIMEQLTNKPVWLKVFSDCVTVDILYPSFEFLHFPKIKQFQFGHAEYNEENNYQNILIDVVDIVEIHKDIISPTQIIIVLVDGLQLIVECDCQEVL